MILSMGDIVIKAKEEQFIPLHVDNFIAGVKTPVDLYIKLGDDKFVKIYRSGDKTEHERLHRYQGKDLSYLWTSKDTLHQLTRHSIEIAEIVINKDNYNPEQKTSFLTKATDNLLNELATNGVTIKSFQSVKQMAQSTQALVDNHRDLFDLMNNLSLSSPDVARYSLAVSILSTLIGKAMEWTNPVTLEKLAVGGLLHRVGLLELPKTLMTTPYSKLSSANKSLFKQYPSKSMELLVQLGVAQEDVVAIVHQHRERNQGKGFPRGLMNSRIHPLARVVGVAEALANLSVANIDMPKPMLIDRAYRELTTLHRGSFNKEVFNAAAKIINRNSLKKSG